MIHAAAGVGIVQAASPQSCTSEIKKLECYRTLHGRDTPDNSKVVPLEGTTVYTSWLPKAGSFDKQVFHTQFDT